MERTRSAAILPLILIGLLTAACAPSAGASATPGATPIAIDPPTALPSPTVPSPTAPLPSPSPSSSPTTDAAAAVARVVASDPRFAGITVLDPGLIGQAAWYEVEPSANGFKVIIHIGWGDCEAGCINRHAWAFQVARDGTVAMESESGPPVPAGVGAGGGPGVGPATLDVVLVAGPVCPVERNPPDPGCAARPVPSAIVVVRDASGVQLARGISDATGHIRLPLPPGSYTVEAQPVQGFMGTPSPAPVTVAPTGITVVQLTYDTGIR